MATRRRPAPRRFKPLARIAAVGHRIHGDPSRRRRVVGYEYVHVAVDDATRLAYVEVAASQRGDACAEFLDRACTCRPRPQLCRMGRGALPLAPWHLSA
jgi:hypothetical protein